MWLLGLKRHSPVHTINLLVANHNTRRDLVCSLLQRVSIVCTKTEKQAIRPSTSAWNFETFPMDFAGPMSLTLPKVVIDILLWLSNTLRAGYLQRRHQARRRMQLYCSLIEGLCSSLGVQRSRGQITGQRLLQRPGKRQQELWVQLQGSSPPIPGIK